MNIVEKRFQHITVGVNMMTDDYQIWLAKKGYELKKTNKDNNGKIISYLFELRAANESERINRFTK